MAVEGDAAGRFPYLDLRDVHGNRFRTRSVIRSDGRLVRVDFGIADPQVDGTPVDLEAIDRIIFRPGPTDRSGKEVLYIDAPDRVVAPETPKVVFMFDDGNETDYTEALPYLSKYGYPAITYVNTALVGEEGRIDETQLRELSSEGWLVGSHTTDQTDLAEVSEQETVERKVREAKEWLVERGFTDGARHFAYPYDSVDEEALGVVSQFHDTGRVHSWQPVALPSNLQLIPADGDVTLPEARQLLEYAERYGGVVYLYYHNLGSGDALASFQRVVDEVHERDRAGQVDVVGLDELEAMVD